MRDCPGGFYSLCLLHVANRYAQGYFHQDIGWPHGHTSRRSLHEPKGFQLPCTYRPRINRAGIESRASAATSTPCKRTGPFSLSKASAIGWKWTAGLISLTRRAAAETFFCPVDQVYRKAAGSDYALQKHPDQQRQYYRRRAGPILQLCTLQAPATDDRNFTSEKGQLLPVEIISWFLW